MVRIERRRLNLLPAKDDIRDLFLYRGHGDVYREHVLGTPPQPTSAPTATPRLLRNQRAGVGHPTPTHISTHISAPPASSSRPVNISTDPNPLLHLNQRPPRFAFISFTHHLSFPRTSPWNPMSYPLSMNSSPLSYLLSPTSISSRPFPPLISFSL